MQRQDTPLAADRLRAARLTAGLTVHDAATRARMAEAVWRAIEAGEAPPPDRLTLKRVFGGHHPLVAALATGARHPERAKRCA